MATDPLTPESALAWLREKERGTLAGERLEQVVAGAEAELLALRPRLALAEAVCLLSGWVAADMVSERGKALTQAWIEWSAEYRAQGGSTSPFHHPELHVEELAAKRDAIVARTLAGLSGRAGDEGAAA